MKTRSSFLAALGGTAVATASVRAAGAEPLPLRLIFFPGVDMLPTWIAQSKGFFAQQNLAVTLTATPGSVYQFQHMSGNDFDIALTAFDNVVAYDEGQGEAQLANPADFVTILGGDSAFLRLYARPEITSYADLRGKTLLVDAVTTGFAFVLRAMLAKNGLHDGGYTLLPVGGTPARFKGLLDGQGTATILNAPFDVLAAAQGMRKLDRVDDVIGPYQGVVSMVRASWLAANLTAATGYVRAQQAGLRWMYDPANRDECVGLLVDNAKLTPELATQMYALLIDPKLGMARDGRLDRAGMQTVLTLRSRYGIPAKRLTDVSRYVDDRPMTAAMR